MANFKRKRSRQQTVGCSCCSILKNNSLTRTKPKDREIAERAPKTRSKRPRPFAIEYKWTTRWLNSSNGWSTWKRYRTEAERAQALRVLNRSHPSSTFRIPA